ncbi:uncharacterized protein BX663DRAFT_448461 [Cokeromyces recurvatus]|uniref:uncharacterized protein n=1 Tax=Cokeromyces recurvatus TaxID=90255 RepID=UPI002220FAC5|nr:uncharacterized protein BX663DRAFT_448461 [Cokeromyces recurvatus]KAI7906719.1 hypothetical protein BX663DRAFT_448461 [Cokeromyces recurvatus]
MSFLLRPLRKTILYTSQQVTKRHAHKKANIEVRLNEYIENLGLKDEIVSVRPGLMRNILYPAGKAEYINKDQLLTKDDMNEDQDKMTEQQEKLKLQLNKLNMKKNELLDNLEQIQELEFNRAVVPNSHHTFGSVTAEDLVQKIKENFGLDIDKSAIEFSSQEEGGVGRIKYLGQHKVFIQVNSKRVEIKVNVKPAN